MRVVKTQTLPTNRCWQHVRKILISYITGRSGAAKGENWTFETDADAVAAGVDTYSYFNEDTTVLPQHNKHELWIRSRTEGADPAPPVNPYPEPGSVDMTALCWLDGRLGSYLAILGFYNTHYQNLVVYFFDRTKDGNVQRVGTGKLLLAETDRIRADIPWRHLRVGGSRAAPVFEKCVCIEKTVVPLIETGQNER